MYLSQNLYGERALEDSQAFLYSVGEKPEYFLNATLNVVLELKPESNAMANIFILLNLPESNLRITSCTL